MDCPSCGLSYPAEFRLIAIEYVFVVVLFGAVTRT